MSADPPRKAYKYTCSMIRPQIYSEKSLMESVVDFFSDVVPQAYTGTQKNEDREKIQWVRFENCDCNDVAKNPDMFRSDTKGLPLLLILGYSNGVQIWHITPNGEAQEVLSMRQGPVRICRILPNPDPVLGNSDSYSYKRPLIIMCDSSSAGQPYCGVKFVSLKTGDEVHSISYKTLPVQNIECNKRFLVNVFLEKVCVYEACQFQQLFWITSCFPCPGPTVNPIALSSRWLAYADKRLVAMHQSCGGMSGDGSQSYAATVISAAKGAFKGLSMFGEAMVSSVTGCKPTAVKRDCVQLDNGNRPGIVTVVDIQNIHNDHFNVNEDNEGDGLIAHFHAHANEPVSNMAFDPTGTLLVTACKLGHNFHVFRLMAHPVSSSLGAVHHLYTLHRGETTAKVIDISFNHDSRWITVSSHRGTTHLFPITPYGGPVNIRTHCKPHIVNRASRFHRSAGLDEFDHSVGRRSPVLSTSPSSSGQYDRYPSLIQQNTLNNNMGNPRLPPYPHPITIYPAFQVKQPLNVALNPGNKNQSPSHSPTGFDNVYCVCAKFCTPRLCVIGSPQLDVERRDGGKRPVDSLFVMAQSGVLVEYVLEPRAKSVSDKVTDDCLLELNVVGRMQWNVQRLKNSPELRPPLPSNSPLILAHEAVASQIPTAPDLYDLPGLTRQDSKDSLSSEHSSKDDSDEQWLSQVEIITHAGPHRRLWMGPQFSFKTYQENTTVLSSNSSSLLSQSPESNMAAMDMMGDEGDLESLKLQPARSNPVSMPNARPAYRRLSGSDSPSTVQTVGAQSVPLLIEAGSFDQSPHLLDVYSNWTESTVAKQPRGSDDLEEDRLKETLADAMVESPCKDLEKLSLRHQDIPRASVRAEKAKGQLGKKIAVGKTEGGAVSPKKKEVTGKPEPEKVKSKTDDKKGKQPETTTHKDKTGKGNGGKQSETEVKVTPVSDVEAPKCDEAKACAKGVEVALDTGKNGKKKGNSRKSLEAQFTNSNTTAKKKEVKPSSSDIEMEKISVKVVNDKKPVVCDKKFVQSKPDDLNAKDSTAKAKNVKLSSKSGTNVNDKSEKDNTNNSKSTAKSSAKTASEELAGSTSDKPKSEVEKDLKLGNVGKNQHENEVSNLEPVKAVLSKEILNFETDVAVANDVIREREADREEEVKVSRSESPAKGRSKRKNKKQNKNDTSDSLNENPSNGETNEICKQLSSASISEKSDFTGIGITPEIGTELNQDSAHAKTENVCSVSETADIQEPVNVADTEDKIEEEIMPEEIKESTVNVEIPFSPLDKDSSKNQNASLNSQMKFESTDMKANDLDLIETVTEYSEAPIEKSSFESSSKIKSKKKKKTGNSSETDLIETQKVEVSIAEKETKHEKNKVKNVEKYEEKVSENKVTVKSADEVKVKNTEDIGKKQPSNDNTKEVKTKQNIGQEERKNTVKSADEVKDQDTENKSKMQPSYDNLTGTTDEPKEVKTKQTIGQEESKITIKSADEIKVKNTENKDKKQQSDNIWTRKTEEQKEVKKKQNFKQEENCPTVKSTNEVQIRENKDKKQPSDVKTPVMDREPKKPDVYDCGQDMFEVKSKKKRRKKKNGMEDSVYVDVLNDTEEQSPLDIPEKASFQEERQENISTASVADNNLVCEVASDCAVLTNTKNASKETRLVAAEDQNPPKSPSNKGIVEAKIVISTEGGKEKEKSATKDTYVQNEIIENVKETKKVADPENEQKLNDDFTEEEIFVVPKRKNRRKKKNEEINSESSRLSPETEIVESRSENIEKSNFNQNIDSKTKSAAELDDDKVKRKLEIKNKTGETCESFDEDSGRKKLNETVEKENYEDGKVTESKEDENGDDIVTSEEKKMEDSTESGSKYETAESTEDDASAWERFEECTDESERDTTVESNSSTCISIEASNEFQFKQDMRASYRKSDEAVDGVSKQQVEKADKGIENQDLIEYIKTEKMSKKLSSNEEEALVLGNKVDMGASVMVMSMYDESTSSSSRSSEERDGIGKVKQASEKESKNKKKKRKNKK